MTTLTSELSNHFVRGAVAGGLLSALQGDGETEKKRRRKSKKNHRKMLKHALQGGFAVSTGMGVANLLQQGNYRHAGGLLLVGALGIAASEWLLTKK